MTKTKETITITREHLAQLHREQNATWHLRDNLSYLTGLFSDIPAVAEKIQQALDDHKKAK